MGFLRVHAEEDVKAFRARNYTRVMAAIVVIFVLIIGVETLANRLRGRLGADRSAFQ